MEQVPFHFLRDCARDRLSNGCFLLVEHQLQQQHTCEHRQVDKQINRHNIWHTSAVKRIPKQIEKSFKHSASGASWWENTLGLTVYRHVVWLWIICYNSILMWLLWSYGRMANYEFVGLWIATVYQARSNYKKQNHQLHTRPIEYFSKPHSNRREKAPQGVAGTRKEFLVAQATNPLSGRDLRFDLPVCCGCCLSSTESHSLSGGQTGWDKTWHSRLRVDDR